MPTNHTSPIWRGNTDYTWPILRIDGYIATVRPLDNGLYEYYADDDGMGEQWSARGNAFTEAEARHAAEQAIVNHIYTLDGL